MRVGGVGGVDVHGTTGLFQRHSRVLGGWFGVRGSGHAIENVGNNLVHLFPGTVLIVLVAGRGGYLEIKG